MNFKSGYVAILGKPNVGKSTLINYFLKEKLSIITEKPQTTRNSILGIYSEKKYQIIFVDTPGMHKARTALGKHMNISAIESGLDADIILVLVDAGKGIQKNDREIFKLLNSKKLLEKACFTAVLINKIDTVKANDLLPIVEACRGLVHVDEYVPISAATGENCDMVLEYIKKALPVGPAYFPADQLTDKNERFIVAELIREQALELTREEVPHSIAVEVKKFQDNPGRKTLIQADIYLERKSQKGIVIGKSAQMLKQIGAAARKEIEVFLQRPVFLELCVKVHVDWRKDEKFIKRLGLEKK